jgi:hypothetical protein
MSLHTILMPLGPPFLEQITNFRPTERPTAHFILKCHG